MPGKSPAQRQQKGETISPSAAAVKRWAEVLTLQAENEENSDFDPSDIIASILGAQSYEEAEAAQDSGLPSSKDLVGHAHRIDSYVIRKSKKNQGTLKLGVYAIVRGVSLTNGEELLYNTGAANILAMLWQAEKFGKIPGNFVITSKETEEGAVLFLKQHISSALTGSAS